MSQGDQSIANQAGAAFRSDLNAELQALVSFSSGATAPATTYAYQYWIDTTTNTLKRRNAANSAWIVIDTRDEAFVVSRSSNTILGLSDYGKTFLATSTFTQTLTAAATLGDGWFCFYRNDGAGVITIDPNSSETIDGLTTITLQPAESIRIGCNGSAFKTQGRWSFESAETALGAAGSNTTFAHGLGVVPRAVYVILRCKTAELGYSIGDEIAWVANATQTVSGGPNVTIYADATNVGIVTNSNAPVLVRKDTFANAGITAANWKYVVRAYKS